MWLHHTWNIIHHTCIRSRIVIVMVIVVVIQVILKVIFIVSRIWKSNCRRWRQECQKECSFPHLLDDWGCLRVQKPGGGRFRRRGKGGYNRKRKTRNEWGVDLLIVLFTLSCCLAFLSNFWWYGIRMGGQRGPEGVSKKEGSASGVASKKLLLLPQKIDFSWKKRRNRYDSSFLSFMLWRV